MSGNVKGPSNFPFQNTTGNLRKEEQQDMSEINLYLVGFLLAVITIMAIFGNFIIIVAVSKKKLCWEKTFASLLNLTINDLFAGICLIPLCLANLVAQKQLYTTAASCDFVAILYTFNAVFSQLSIALLAIERYVMLRFPLEHRRWFAKSVVAASRACLLIITTILSIVPTLFLKSVYHTELHLCLFDLDKKITGTLIFMGISLLIPWLALIYCSAGVAIIVWKRRNTAERTSNIPMERQEERTVVSQYRREIRSSVVILTIVLVFTGCNLPLMITFICDISGYCRWPKKAMVASVLIFFSRSALNPLMYGLSNIRMRGIIMDLLHCNTYE